MIMKKIINSLFVIVASMVTFAGCQKEENNAPAAGETKTVQFFANSIETKTHFADKTADNKYPTLWDAGDKVKVLMNLEKPTGISGLETTSEALTASDILNDGASARFKVELNDGTPDEQGDVYTSDSYTYYAVVPSSAYNSKSDADGGRVTVIIPIAQTPQPNALDKAAQIIYSVSEAYPSIQDAVSLDFKHFTAYGKFSLTNLTNQIGTIKTVALKFDDVNIAGKWNYYPSTDTKGVHEAGSNTITLTTSSATDIWFACAPVDVSGKKLTVTVTDVDGKQLVKEITMPADRVFESGKVSTFTVNMNGLVPPVQEETTKSFQKVTEAPSDWSGTYLIVYEAENVAFDGSLSSLDVANNTISVTITNSKITYTDALMNSVFIVEKDGTNYSLKSASGRYIGSTTYDNDIDESTTTKYPNTFSISNGIVQIGATDTNSGQSIMKYNDTSGQKRFRYYKSGQKNIQLYKLVDGDVGGETPAPDGPETPDPDPTPDPEPEQPGQGGDDAELKTSSLVLTSSKKFGTTSGSTLKADDSQVWKITTISGGAIQNIFNNSYQGQQIGTGTSPWVGTFTSDFSGKNIKSIKILANTGEKASLSVTVGNVDFGTKAVTKNASNALEYLFEGSASGNVTIKVSDTKKAFYLGAIVVTYN